MSNTIKIIAACSTLALLSACGGTDPTAKDFASLPSASSSASSVSGIASKGMLDGADVTVSELVGALWLARGNAKTKSDGSYTATLKDYKDGPIRITVDSLGNTKMICDVPSGCIDKNGAQKGFGASVDIGEGLTMEAILSKKSDTAYVTP